MTVLLWHLHLDYAKRKKKKKKKRGSFLPTSDDLARGGLSPTTPSHHLIGCSFAAQPVSTTLSNTCLLKRTSGMQTCCRERTAVTQNVAGAPRHPIPTEWWC